MAKGTFNGEYIKSAELGKLSNGKVIELGHYKIDGKEYSDKIYIREEYFKRNGDKAESVTKTNLTIKELAELQKIDLSQYDTDTDEKAIFD